jgi:hypothetical protein
VSHVKAALVVAISAFACEARERRGGANLSANSEDSEEWRDFALPAFFGTGLRLGAPLASVPDSGVSGFVRRFCGNPTDEA